MIPPRLVKKQEPEYPELARQWKLQGRVILRGLIDEIGKFHVLRPVGGGLYEKAVETVQGWRFEPARKRGQPVTVLAMSK